MAKPNKAKSDRAIKKLEAFLADRVPAVRGYPIVTDDTMRALYDLFGDILDAKFERDEDGDMVIDYAFCDRKRSQLAHFTIPHDPRTGDPSDQSEFLARLARAAESANGYAESIMKRLSFKLQDDADEMKDKRTLRGEISDVEKLLDAADLDAAEKAIQALIDKHDPDGAKRKDDPDFRGYRKLPDALYDLLSRFGREVPHGRIDPAIKEMNKALDTVEEFVGQPDHLWDKKVSEYGVRKLLYGYQYRYGTTVFQSVIKRFNDMGNDDRAIRKLLERRTLASLAPAA